MARQPSPQKAHKPKDFCTIEQASYIAQEVIKTAPLIHTLGSYAGGPADQTIQGAVTQLKRWIAVAEERIAELETPWYKRVWQALTRREA